MSGHINFLHDDLCAREDPGLLDRVGTRQAGGRGEHHDQPRRLGPLEVDAVELGGHGPTALGRRLGPSAPYDDRDSGGEHDDRGDDEQALHGRPPLCMSR